MRNSLIFGFIALGLSACGGGGGNDVECGDGTTLTDGVCIANGGSDVTCGSGTTLQDGVCVADGSGSNPGSGSGSGSGGAPTVTKIDPPDDGVSGYDLFTITGTNFTGTGVSDLHVYFGAGSGCEAEVGAATETTIAGEIPPACGALDVNVLVTTSTGSASIPFHYDAVLVADGSGGGVFYTEEEDEYAGYLWIMDPFTGVAGAIGALTDSADADGYPDYGMSGIAFGSDGTLYGVTTGNSAGDPVDGESQFATIDSSGVVTVLGPTEDGSGNSYTISDIKVVGGTVFGWGYWLTGTEASPVYHHGLVKLSTTDGTVTRVGSGGSDDFGFAGLAANGSGNLFLAEEGAGSDQDFGFSGELDSVNAMTGALTPTIASLDWAYAAPVQSMEYVGSNLFALVDEGTYGALTTDPTEDGNPIPAGVTYTYINTAAAGGSADPYDIPLFEAPAFPGQQSMSDGMATVPVAAPGGISMHVPQHLGWYTPKPRTAVAAHVSSHTPRAWNPHGVSMHL